jgi:ubiquinone/menaquinone biosynthesis C-methylase UbiE
MSITPRVNAEISLGMGEEAERAHAMQWSNHFTEVSSHYDQFRELDVRAVHIISEVLAAAIDQRRPVVRLLDVGTGEGRYLDAVSDSLSASLANRVLPVGVDLSPAMLTQAHVRNRRVGLSAEYLVSASERLPFLTATCDAVTSFNAVHHFDLDRFVSEASRVLIPSGQLVLYTRTPEQNRCTIWGRYFPEFATRETMLYRSSDLQLALQADEGFDSVRVQIIPWKITTSLSRLIEQVTHCHYSTFRLYSTDLLRAAIDTFHYRVGHAFSDMDRITFNNDHTVVIAKRLDAN